MRVISGISSNIGDRPANADAAAVAYAPATGAVAAALVDGVGSRPEVVETVPIAAEVIARTAARSSALAGMMAAAAMMADPTRTGPNAVAVAARYIEARDTWQVSWVGDAAAIAMVDGELTVLTEEHTVGALLRAAGVAETDAARWDHRVRIGLATATVATVGDAWATTPLMILASDGVRRALDGRLADIVRDHQDDPQTLADALVKAAVAAARDAGDVADNATAVVLQLVAD